MKYDCTERQSLTLAFELSSVGMDSISVAQTFVHSCLQLVRKLSKYAITRKKDSIFSKKKKTN